MNPWWGCDKVSPACAHCYAEAWAKRCGWTGIPGKKGGIKPAIWGGGKSARRFFGDEHWREPLKWNADAIAAGKRERVFCASMADVFEDRDDLTPHLHRLFALIIDTPALDWLLLTKRPEAWAKRLEDVMRWNENNGGRPDVHAWALDWRTGDRVPPNVWIGATAENQHYADKRGAALFRIPAVIRFLSMEPLLGDVDLEAAAFKARAQSFEEIGVPSRLADDVAGTFKPLDGLHWIIVGGESGGKDKRRPFDLAWLDSLARQADRSGVALHVKQDAGGSSGQQGRIPDHLWRRKEFPVAA